MDLKDKVVVITGSSKGLGKELAIGFMRRGSKVVISSRDEKELDGVSAEIGAFAIQADVTDENQVKKLSQKTIKKFGRIDIWVNNAGIWLPHCSVGNLDLKKVHQMVEVNLFGTMYGSRSALIHMKKQNNGIIVNILSTSALEGRANSSGYCASKYAATGFTKSLRKELSDIKVLSVYPGGMKTSFFEERKPENYNEYMDPSYVAKKVIDNLEKDNPEEEQIIRRL